MEYAAAAHNALPAGRRGRPAAIVATWALVAVALYVGWWGAIAWPTYSLGVLVTAAPFYGPLVAAAVAVPAALHLLAGRFARAWSALFLAGSLLVPLAALLAIRGAYVEQTARGMHVEGKGLWSAFALLTLLGSYGAASALVFALAVRNGPTERRRFARLLLVGAVAALLLHAAAAVGQFAPYFAWVYG